MRSLARAVTLSQQPSSLPPPPPPQTSLLTISHFLKACHVSGNNLNFSMVSLKDKGYPLGQPNFFFDFRLKLHGEVWAKSCLETNFQPIRMLFDLPSEASKLAIFKAF